MPRNPGPCGRDTRGRKVERPFDGQCHRKSNRRSVCRKMTPARVKRCGKSAPREAQATRHGKPHRVQGQIGNPGAARSRFRESETDSGYRLHRQMVLSPRKRADRIRLTALPKPFPKSSVQSAGARSTSRHAISRAAARTRPFRSIQHHHGFSAAHRLGPFQHRRQTQIPGPIHRADRNHLRSGIFKRPRRLAGRQDFRRPNLVGPILQDPQPRRFAAGCRPLQTQPGAAFHQR